MGDSTIKLAAGQGGARPGGWLGHKGEASWPLLAARFDKVFDLPFHVRRQPRPGSNHHCQSRIIVPCVRRILRCGFV